MQNYPKSEVDNSSAVNGRDIPRGQWHKPVITCIDMRRTLLGSGSLDESTGPVKTSP